MGCENGAVIHLYFVVFYTLQMVSPYVAEFIGSVVFFIIVWIVVFHPGVPSSNLIVAALVGFGLFLGVWICLSIGGPGFQNPAVAIQNSVIGGNTAGYAAGMIIVELLAVVVSLAIYWLVMGSLKPPVKVV